MEITAGLIALIAIVGISLPAIFYICHRKGWFQWDRVTDDDVVKSYVVPARVQLVFRGVVFLYSLGVILHTAVMGRDAYAFYTVWNFTLLTIYFGIVFVASLGSALSAGSSHPTGPQASDAHTTKLSTCITWVLFEICVTNVFLVDITLWAVLYPHAKKEGDAGHLVTFSSINEHGVNLLFMVVELVLNVFPHSPAHFIFLVALSLTYGGFQWVYHACGGKWAYFFLDTSKETAPLWYCGMIIGHGVFFAFTMLLTWARTRYLKKNRANAVDEEKSLLPNEL